MKIRIEITEKDLQKLIHQHLEDQVGAKINPEMIRIEVKSKQNFKSEWERADFRAVYEANQ